MFVEAEFRRGCWAVCDSFAEVGRTFADHVQAGDMVQVTAKIHFIWMDVMTFHLDHLPKM